ncbi:MAG: malate synthase G, partial [Halieaceae bacterium]
MPKRIECAGLQIDEALHSLLVQEIAPGTGIEPDHFWQGLADIWAALGPENKRLLAERDSLQAQIDQWHRDHRVKAFNSEAYEAFLREIGYLHPEPTPFTITTDNVDPEIATIAGPQLVVPVINARYALNAANARWGSLYDALYGTDAISEEGGAERGGAYNPVRGERVIAWARDFLDTHCPLTGGTHADATAYVFSAGALSVQQASGEPATLADASQFAGYTGSADAPESVLLCHNGLHIEIQIDRNHAVGATDA